LDTMFDLLILFKKIIITIYFYCGLFFFYTFINF
jgi:hypothetical protein